MSLQLRQNLKLSQQLVMTPQLQQAIKLLQLNKNELIETVEQALLENPLLEKRQEQEEDSEENAAGDSGGQPSSSEGRDGDAAFVSADNELSQAAEWEDYLGLFSSSAKSSREREIPEEMASLEAVYSAKPSLESHLLWQLHLSHFSFRQMTIGDILIHNLDSSGYLGLELEEVANLADCSTAEVEEVLLQVQRFDPVGVASRSLQECLLRQLEVQGYGEEPLFTLVREHLPEIERHSPRALAGKLGVTAEQMEGYMQILRGLDPRPGNSFGPGEVQYVSPDVYVYYYDGEFVISLAEEGLPDLGLNPQYLNLSGDNEKKEKEYIQEKTREAMWLIRSIHQRQRTLYRVTESIVRFQEEFFRKGVSELKPMVLRDVAEDIEVHESTVSRVTANKFISTPFGIYEMKFFFSSGLGKNDGEQMSAVSVKDAIKKLIQSEDSRKPLSDKDLVQRLNEEYKLNIARRTVAKYREGQGIPSSSRRKRKG